MKSRHSRFDTKPFNLFFGIAALLGAVTVSHPVPAAEQAVPLTLEQTIRLAVDNYVTLKLARALTLVEQGKKLQDTANLLPHLLASVSQSHVYRANLAALGFTGGALPMLIGPFNVFDARLQLVQSLFSLADWERRSAAVESTRAAELTEQLVAEEVAGMAGLSYVEAIRARRAIQAAQAGVELADRLLRLAQERRRAGTATGLEVARAQTRAAEEKLRVLDAKTAFEEALLRVKHLAAIPLSRPIELQEPAMDLFRNFPTGEPEAVAAALTDRLELQIAAAQLNYRTDRVKSAKAEHLPTVVGTGAIAFSGNTPTKNDDLVGSIGVGLSMPLFEGGRIRGRVLEAEGERRKVEARLDDLKVQVEEDVRLSLQKLKDATDRVETTNQARDLAERELNLEQDRFQAGVGDNVEVVNAQTILARNQDANVAAAAQYQMVQINLALALGRMRKTHF
ncbi:MAG: TolC family protein [Pseudomonadota bacterium]